MQGSFFDAELLPRFTKVSQALETLPYIKDINSPLESTLIHQHEDTLYTETYQQALDEGHIDIPNYRDYFLISEEYGALLSSDERIAVIQLTMVHKKDGQNFVRKSELIPKIREVLASDPLFKDAFLSGNGYVNYDMDLETRNNLIRLLPLAILSMLLVLRYSLGAWIKSLIVLITTLLSLLSALLCLILLGYPLTIINLTLIILILVIAIADSIHILNRWEHINQADPGLGRIDTLKATVKETWLPCFVTTASTAIGFGSFSISQIVPLKSFGILSVIAILSAYIVIMFSTVLLIYLVSQHIQVTQRQHQELRWDAQYFYSWVNRYPKTIVIISLLLAISIGSGLRYLYTESNFLNVFYKQSSLMQENTRYIDENLSGTGSIDLLISTESEQLKSIDTFRSIEDILGKIRRLSEINKAYSYLTPVRMIHRSFSEDGSIYPQSDAELEQELLFLEFSRSDRKNDVLSSYVDFDYSSGRMQLHTPNLSSTDTGVLLRKLREIIAPTGLAIRESGQHVLTHVLSNYVIQTQIKSFLITGALLWIFFILYFGFKLGTIGLLPNLIPMAITLGSISWLGIPFDFATVLIASIALGLCVDDSIHFLHYYKHCKDEGVDLPIRRTMQAIGKPLWISSLLLSVGFGLFISSNLVILVKLGAFTVLAIVLAYLADMLMLPAALKLWDRD